ncbi:MAG: STAS domain-containing protein [Deltaproteobacteria bacterium]|jgi:anti-anti-sigma factor|nr:STAS domain-containing protein [Deltaproteobacteria bacterium]
MNIQIIPKDNCTVIALEGRLEAGQAEKTQAAVQGALADGPPNLLLDCAKLSYVASMGLRCFLLAQKEAQKAGGRAIFSGLNENVRSVFAITGFDKLTQVLETAEEALALFSAASGKQP